MCKKTVKWTIKPWTTLQKLMGAHFDFSQAGPGFGQIWEGCASLWTSGMWTSQRWSHMTVCQSAERVEWKEGSEATFKADWLKTRAGHRTFLTEPLICPRLQNLQQEAWAQTILCVNQINCQWHTVCVLCIFWSPQELNKRTYAKKYPWEAVLQWLQAKCQGLKWELVKQHQKTKKKIPLWDQNCQPYTVCHISIDNTCTLKDLLMHYLQYLQAFFNQITLVTAVCI